MALAGLGTGREMGVGGSSPGRPPGQSSQRGVTVRLRLRPQLSLSYDAPSALAELSFLSWDQRQVRAQV